jgi:O-antigen/teichoic acid export membrane protein
MAFKLGSVHLLYFQRTRTYVKLQTFMEYGAAGAGLAAAVVFGLNGMLVMNVFVALLIGGWGWRTLRTSRARPLRDPFWSAAVRIAVPLLPVTIAQWALFSADALLLLSMLGATAAGAYSTAYSLGSIALLFPLGLSAVWFPTAQRLLLRSSADFRATAVRVGLWVLVWGVVAVSASLIARPLIDRVLSDSVYADVSGSVPFVVLGFVFFGFGKIGEGMLYASGAWRPIVGAYTAGAILNIALNVYWIPTHGIRGAAYATAAGYAATALILTACATKRPGLISA